MYKNRSEDGNNNICGKQVKFYRELLSPKTSQRLLADISTDKRKCILTPFE